ncbi:hypothetical protein MAR_035811 [Mya arenaria]|uniref:Cadherin domain-containing protein n=1 Tax=Mya arenaria TaxID=6604 RepID=A0ABY7ENE9_MYAAR|nr:hypothetical protein MAR_035811 [Mya arenaria]
MTAKNAQITAWAITDGGGTAGTISGTAPAGTATVSIAEATAVGGTLFTVTATPTGTGAALAYTFVAADGNPGDIGNIATASSGAITLATGKSLDYETTKTYEFKIIGEEGGDNTKTGTVTVTLSITDAVDITRTGFCLSESSYAAGSSIGTLMSEQTATYGTLAGTDNTIFAVATTGEITVATGQTVAVATKTYYTFTIVGSTTATGVDDSLATGIHVVLQCSSSSGAGQVAALISMLAVSVATHLFF